MTDVAPAPFAIVTGADAGFFTYLEDLIASIRRHPALDDIPIGVMDFGLSEEQRGQLRDDGIRVRSIDWDIEVPERVRHRTAGKASLCRPFIPKYFPEFEACLWLDADIWVQRADAVLLYRQAVETYGAAIVPEFDVTYGAVIAGVGQAYDEHLITYVQLFGADLAQRLMKRPVLNAGAFALRRDHPLWAEWQRTCTEAVARHLTFSAEQASLNVVAYRMGQVHFLPAWCNWICGLALPLWDAGRRQLVSPGLPHEPLGLVHVTRSVRQPQRLATRDGQVIDTALTFRGMAGRLGPAR